jgi:LPXTG-motif cell wall-anchored protein
MVKTLASRLAVLAAGVTMLLGAGGLALAQPGQAQPTEQATEVPLKEDHRDVTADQFNPDPQPDDCDGPFADIDENEDGWHFVLTQFNGGTDDVEFVLQFEDTEGEPVEITENATEVTGGVAHLWLVTPAGWTLVDGVAVVTPPGSVGDNPQFNLSHTCPGVPETPTLTPPTPTPTATAQPPRMSPGFPPGEGGGLPTTGNHVAALAVLGVGLLGVGIASLAVRRRRGQTAS